MQNNISIKNPFEEVNAVNLDDEQILEYWIKPAGIFNKQVNGVEITGLTPIFLFGGRGTGKTTVLKYISFEIQKKEFIKKVRNRILTGFLENRKFLGIYYRFDGPQLAAFNSGLDDAKCLESFRMFLELILAQKYLLMLEELIAEKSIHSSFDQRKLCERLSHLIYGKIIPSLNTIKKFRKKLSEIQFSIEKSRDLAVIHGKEIVIRQIIPRGRLIFDLQNEVRHTIKELRNINIIYLFDEYENLEHSQQLLINTMIKHHPQHISFKIGTRLQGVKTYDTLNTEEYLRAPADFRSVIFEELFHSANKEFKKLLIGIAERRLSHHPQFSKLGLTDITKFLGHSPSPEKEALDIISESKDKTRHHYTIIHGIRQDISNETLSKIKCPDQPLLEKLNLMLRNRGYPISKIHLMMNSFINKQKKTSSYKQYANLYEKNKVALLFQLASDYRRGDKSYVGFEAYVSLSSGIIRNFLELCFLAFNLSIFHEKDNLLSGGRIQDRFQNDAVYTLSNKFFNDISSIPGDSGQSISRLVDNTGSIFRSLHKDPLISEPEPSYFSTEYDNLDLPTMNVIDIAVKWSILQKKESMKPKDRSQAHLVDFHLNRMLCPKYTISYRRRGRTQITTNELSLLIFGSDKIQKEIRETIGKLKDSRKARKMEDQGQPKIIDFFD